MGRLNNKGSNFLDNNIFVDLCKLKFSYITDEFRFNKAIVEDEINRLYIIYERPGFRIRIINNMIESPSFPIEICLEVERKKLLNKFFKKIEKYDLDDLLIYKKCKSQVYEYLDYCDIETFYEIIPEAKIRLYEEIEIIIDKYSRLLKDFGTEVLSGNYEILPLVGKMRKEYDAKYGCGSQIV